MGEITRYRPALHFLLAHAMRQRVYGHLDSPLARSRHRFKMLHAGRHPLVVVHVRMTPCGPWSSIYQRMMQEGVLQD
jgi:hypothetical protein